MAGHLVERLTPHTGHFFSVRARIFATTTPYQTIEIVDTDALGRVLLLDDAVQVAERGERAYHEPLVHPAMTSHPAPERVCIIGGGDGGALREVLRHGPKHVVLCDLDEAVMQACARHLPMISDGAFEHPAVERVVEDGRRFIERTDTRFDVIIMDMTDPAGPSSRLYTQEFFAVVKARLRDDRGLFVMHASSPIHRPQAFRQILRTTGQIWPAQHIFYPYVQMYGGLWSVLVCGADDTLAAIGADAIERRLTARGIDGLEVYSPRTHHGMQAAPPHIEALRTAAADARPITDAAPLFDDHVEFMACDDTFDVVPAE